MAAQLCEPRPCARPRATRRLAPSLSRPIFEVSRDSALAPPALAGVMSERSCPGPPARRRPDRPRQERSHPRCGVGRDLRAWPRRAAGRGRPPRRRLQADHLQPLRLEGRSAAGADRAARQDHLGPLELPGAEAMPVETLAAYAEALLRTIMIDRGVALIRLMKQKSPRVLPVLTRPMLEIDEHHLAVLAPAARSGAATPPHRPGADRNRCHGPAGSPGSAAHRCFPRSRLCRTEQNRIRPAWGGPGNCEEATRGRSLTG